MSSNRKSTFIQVFTFTCVIFTADFHSIGHSLTRQVPLVNHSRWNTLPFNLISCKRSHNLAPKGTQPRGNKPYSTYSIPLLCRHSFLRVYVFLLLYYTIVLFYVSKVLYTRTEHGFNKQQTRIKTFDPSSHWCPIANKHHKSIHGVVQNIYLYRGSFHWISTQVNQKGKLLIKSNSNLSFQVYLLHNCNAHKFFMYFQELVRELYQKQCKM